MEIVVETPFILGEGQRAVGSVVLGFEEEDTRVRAVWVVGSGEDNGAGTIGATVRVPRGREIVNSIGIIAGRPGPVKRTWSGHLDLEIEVSCSLIWCSDG